jgi:plastocyanin
MELESGSTKNNSSMVPVLFGIITLLVLGLGGEYYYYHNTSVSRQGVPTVMATSNSGGQTNTGEGRGSGPNGMSMAGVTPPPVSNQQKQQLVDGVNKSSRKKIFNITAGNFYFVPNKITVNKGDEVTFIMTNAGGSHNILIDEMNVKNSPVKTADTITATFVPEKTGSFVYYCSVGEHRAKGMWGTLVVQ